MNKFVVDSSQGAKLVHFMGHFGKLKPLRTFVDKFDLRLDGEDDTQHTIVHYAARQGELAILLYLQDFPEIDLAKEN